MPAPEQDIVEPQSGILHAMTKEEVRAMALVIRDFLGAPYVWGGSSVEGTDCSGFVCAVFRDALGVDLPRSAAEMYDFGMVSSDESLQFADLVFLSESSESGITHVGIYIAQGKFVHASPTKGVMISNLNDEFHRDHYAGARRIVGRASPQY
jgi:cell wall-associated NlpC family hydrolase